MRGKKGKKIFIILVKKEKDGKSKLKLCASFCEKQTNRCVRKMTKVLFFVFYLAEKTFSKKLLVKRYATDVF